MRKAKKRMQKRKVKTMWAFDYRTYFNPETDTIKVWYGCLLVGELHNEAAARELQKGVQGRTLQAGDLDPARSAPSTDPPAVKAAAPAPEPPTGNPEFVRVTCPGPLHNAICKVLGYQGRRFRVVVVSDGELKGTETAIAPENCVPHGAHGA